ncbi:hypothetical protein [Micromonospora sp. LOL_024]
MHDRLRSAAPLWWAVLLGLLAAVALAAPARADNQPHVKFYT